MRSGCTTSNSSRGLASILEIVCLVAHELRSGRTLRLWHDELGEQPPYRTDSGVLFVNFVANAECACHLALGWPLPKNVLDLSPLFRNLVNGRYSPEGKGLIGALRYYGFQHWPEAQRRYARPHPARLAVHTGGAESDSRILRRGHRSLATTSAAHVVGDNTMDLRVALYHGEFAATAALMEHYGVPYGPLGYTNPPKHGPLAYTNSHGGYAGPPPTRLNDHQRDERTFARAALNCDQSGSL